MTEHRPRRIGRILEHIILVLALLWAGGCTFVWTQVNMPQRIATSSSPDGTCEVTISEVGSPFFFGPSTIRIEATWDTNPNIIGTEYVTEIETTLYNDGKSLDKSNFDVTWRDHVPTVITHGEEQPDQYITLDWRNAEHSDGAHPQ